MADSNGRSAAAILAELYPPPHQINIVRPVSQADLLAIPSTPAARLLLPGAGVVAAASLGHARRPRTTRSKIETSLARAALRTGTAQIVGSGFRVRRSPGAESIESLLESVLGRPVVVGVFLGPPRANRKPVLQIMDRSGSLLAVAKVGMNPLTRELAANEAAALNRLAEMQDAVLTTPSLLHFGRWRDHTVLVQSALDLSGAPTEINAVVRDEAMRAVSEMNGVHIAPWSTCNYISRLRERVAALGRSTLAGEIRDAVDRVAGTEEEGRFGTWHGDWTAWNMATSGHRALVWDWERYDPDVPLGFDALHYAFMPALKTDGRRERAALDLIINAERTLRPFGILGTEANRISVSYILDLATRYLADGQAETGVSGGHVAEWLEPALGAVRARGISGVGETHG
jgi:hypothetical protein